MVSRLLFGAAFALLSAAAFVGCFGWPAETEASAAPEKPEPAAIELPVRGLHVLVSGNTDLALCEDFIRNVLPAEGVNVLVAEINYGYRYASRPQVASQDPLSKEDLRRLVKACTESGINFVPEINCMGHQSWAGEKGALLKAFPQFDETPWIPDGDRSIYCRSYCPLHPDVRHIVFDLIDELADVSGATDFHVGMDEVFLIAEDKCPRCASHDPADLFAGEATALRDHLAANGRTMWMWGDRLIDAEAHFVGMFEASANGTHPAVDVLAKDVVICDWHYERVPSTLEYFLEKGFRVVACPWRVEAVALHQLAAIRRLRRESDRALGVMQTTWCDFGEFVRAYNGESENEQATEAARCFRTLFAAIREGDGMPSAAEANQEEARKPAPLALEVPGEVIARGRYRVVQGGSKAGLEDFAISRTSEGYHLAAHGIPPSGFGAPFAVTLSADASLAAWSAKLQERVAVPLEARYHLAEGGGRAKGTLGGLDIPSQEITAKENAVLVGPSHAGWAFVVYAADLGVGESADIPIVVFGLGSWQMLALDCKLSREDDETVLLADGSQVESQHYGLGIVTPMGQVPGAVWTDRSGTILRLKIATAVGPIEATLQPPGPG